MPTFTPARRRILLRTVAIGAVSAAATVAVGSLGETGILAATGVVAAVAGALAVEVAVLRRQLGGLRRDMTKAQAKSKEAEQKRASALKDARRTIKDLSAGQRELARELVRSGTFDTTRRPLPKFIAAGVANGLVSRGDALDAHRLLTETDALDALAWDDLRSLAGALFGRGYLTRAHEVASILAERSRASWDIRSRDAMAADIAVLSGEFRPQITAEANADTVANRVLHVVGHSIVDRESGYSIRTHYTARAQIGAGLDPQVVSLNGTEEPEAEHGIVTVEGVTYHQSRGPLRGAANFDQWLQSNVDLLADIVRDIQPAVLHAASDFAIALTAEVVGQAFGIPVIYESRGFWEETWLSRQAQTYDWTDLEALESAYGLPDAYLWRREIEDACRQRADHVVTLADVMADRIVAGGVAPDRVSVVPNAVSVDLFPLLTRDQDLAKSLNIEPSTTVIGYISSIVEYEGIDTLICAYSQLRAASTEPTILLIVGDGLELENLRQLASDRGLGAGEVIFTGRVPHDEVLRYYSLIDVFVVPRKPVEVCHLVTPLKPFEAFSTGRTVVLSNVRALANIADQSKAAALFEAGDPDSLAAVLAGLIADPQRRRELSEAGARWVRAERTWEHNAELYARLYATLGVVPTNARR